MEDPIQIIIIVIIMVVGAVRWIIENVVKKGKDSQDQDQGGTLEDLYEEARREILDRQGRMYPENETSQPPPAQPTRPAERRRVVPPPVPTVQPPAIPERRAVGQTSLAERFKPKKVTRQPLTADEEAALARINAREAKPYAVPTQGINEHTTVRALLSTPQATRKAILLREILGPPKSMEN